MDDRTPQLFLLFRGKSHANMNSDHTNRFSESIDTGYPIRMSHGYGTSDTRYDFAWKVKFVGSNWSESVS